jgi:vitamin B12 transporter
VTGHRIGLNVVASHLNSQYDGSEAPTYSPDPDFRNKLNSEVIALDYRGAITPAWTTTAQVSHNNDDLKSGGTVMSRFRTQRDQLTWQNALTLGIDQQLVLAIEQLNDKAHSDSFTDDVKRDNTAAVLGYTGSFGAHVIQADLRHDHNSVYGNNTTGRLGWSMEIANNLRVRALAGTTFRAPSFNELYFPGFGVPDIAPERGRSVELGINWRASDSEASATVYQNRLRDLILYETDRTLCPADPAYDFGCARNIGRARLQGATFTGAQRWGAWHVRGTVDFLDAKNTDTGARLTRRAAHQESLAADYDLGAWNVGGALLAVGARPDGTATLASYVTLDLRARWRWTKQWQLEAKLLNATNREIEPARDYQSLGRQAWIGVRYDGKGL